MARSIGGGSRYDAVVIDCAPTAETLRLLALPEALDRLVARGFPLEARIARLVPLAVRT